MVVSRFLRLSAGKSISEMQYSSITIAATRLEDFLYAKLCKSQPHLQRWAAELVADQGQGLSSGPSILDLQPVVIPVIYAHNLQAWHYFML